MKNTINVFSILKNRILCVDWIIILSWFLFVESNDLVNSYEELYQVQGRVSPSHVFVVIL